MQRPADVISQYIVNTIIVIVGNHFIGMRTELLRGVEQMFLL